jgi:deoxyribodipyrimidine photolyase-related protein
MNEATLIYPHQLFAEHPCLRHGATVFLIEDPLFFNQYQFHKKKLLLHRATMKMYEQHLKEGSYTVRYIESHELKQSEEVAQFLSSYDKVRVAEVCDDWLSRSIRNAVRSVGALLEVSTSPNFLTDVSWGKEVFAGKKQYFFTSFYREQRKRLDILLDHGEPQGGKWTFDTENRKKLPKKIVIPELSAPKRTQFVDEAATYVNTHFSNNPGETKGFCYPVTYQDSLTWLERFITDRFEQFGEYEDAIAHNKNFLFHSVLTPMLNSGLLCPEDILVNVLEKKTIAKIPLNSLEGFIRQIIGWREYMRLLYLLEGRKQRTKNFWQHTRKIPSSFWNATTGIDPLDAAISRVLNDAYTHHIERLMVIGNFMLLCEFDPNEIYRWFMELFIDAYDWVMVPNVYGMSQYADGGKIVTKPYVSSSNYIRKMSDFKKGEWCEVWDALYWRFLSKHRAIFETNPRSKMVVSHLDKMGAAKLTRHKECAERFLSAW